MIFSDTTGLKINYNNLFSLRIDYRTFQSIKRTEIDRKFIFDYEIKSLL